MIPRLPFGHTGHKSSRIIFGGYALSNTTQAEADKILEILLEYGVNHIDTACMYGDSEKRIGPWMESHRDDFFIATKTRRRSYEEAWKDLERSLKHLKIDQIDLWQIHGLTNQGGWKRVMGKGGALEALVQAREEGLVRFLGVTGHGDKVPMMHRQSLEYFDFDSVLLPYNYVLMQKSRYALAFDDLVALCSKKNVAVQTIKSISRRPWGKHEKTHNTYFYEPLDNQHAIDRTVHWALGLENSFVITAGDIKLVPMMLDAANRFKKSPSNDDMDALVEEFDIQPAVFSMNDLK